MRSFEIRLTCTGSALESTAYRQEATEASVTELSQLYLKLENLAH